MKIDSEMPTDGSVDYYNESFRYVLESHMSYLRTLASTAQVVVPPIDTAIYNNDFFGYLNSRHISQCYHWVIMRVNNYFSPSDFTDGVGTILLPDMTVLEKIRQSWNSSKNNVLSS